MIHNNSFPKGKYPLTVAWHFRNAANEPYDISGYNLSVVYRTSQGETPVDTISFSEDGSSVSWMIPITEQKWAGNYSLFLIAKDMASGKEVFKVAYTKAFTLTPNLCPENILVIDEDEEDKVVNLYTIAKYTMFSNTPVITVDEQGYLVSDGERMRYSQEGKYAKLPEKLSELEDDPTHRLFTDEERERLQQTYIKPTSGIPEEHLDDAVRNKLAQGVTAKTEVEIVAGVANDALSRSKALEPVVSSIQTELPKKYVKPGTGIPESDLAQAIKDKLAKGDNIVNEQEYIIIKDNEGNPVIRINKTTRLVQVINKYGYALLNLFGATGNLVSDGDVISQGQGGNSLNAIARELPTKYTKPSSGIPESDLSQSVQEKLNNRGDEAKWGNISGNLTDQTDLSAELRKKYEKPSAGIPQSDLNPTLSEKIDEAMAEARWAFNTVGPLQDNAVRHDIVQSLTSAAKTRARANIGALGFTPTSEGRTSVFPAVLYQEQILTDEQKGQACDNIGAYKKPSKGIPESDLATALKNKLALIDRKADKMTVTSAIPDDEEVTILPNEFCVMTDEPLAVFYVIYFLENTTHMESIFKFTTGDDVPTIEWDGITAWLGGEPIIKANKTYIVSVLDGLGVIGEF